MWEATAFCICRILFIWSGKKRDPRGFEKSERKWRKLQRAKYHIRAPMEMATGSNWFGKKAKPDKRGVLRARRLLLGQLGVHKERVVDLKINCFRATLPTSGPKLRLGRSRRGNRLHVTNIAAFIRRCFAEIAVVRIIPDSIVFTLAARICFLMSTFTITIKCVRLTHCFCCAFIKIIRRMGMKASGCTAYSC